MRMNSTRGKKAMSKCGEAWQEMQDALEDEWPPQDDGWIAWAEEQDQKDLREALNEQ